MSGKTEFIPPMKLMPYQVEFLKMIAGNKLSLMPALDLPKEVIDGVRIDPNEQYFAE